MNPFFSTPEREKAFRDEMEKWIGTPWSPNACIPGPSGGVSCQKLAGALYAAAGLTMPEPPAVPMDHWRFHRISLVEEWLRDKPFFHPLQTTAGARLGDAIGFRLGGCIHHIGVVVDGWHFVHAIQGKPVRVDSFMDSTWGSRVARIWRPIE